MRMAEIPASNPPAAGNQVNQYHDDGDHQQDVNKRTYGVACDQTEQPKDDEYDRNRV
jgi:hypothetical protein